MVTPDDFDRIDIRVGVIVEVQDFPRAKKPSYRARIDFGPEIGSRWTSMQATGYPKHQLIGMQVVAVINFPPKNIAGFMSEVLVLGVPQQDGELSLLVPSRPARLGGRVY